MDITEADRGFLVSKMSDQAVAGILGKSIPWVRKQRAFLAAPAAPAAKVVAADFSGVELTPQRQAPSKPAAKTDVDATGPRGAPIELKGLALAEWLYDNTQATFGDIAELAGVTAAEVDQIANGLAATIVETPKKSPQRPIEPADVGSYREAAKASPAPAPGPRTIPQAEIPPRVVRWAGFFIKAGWSWRETARLFDVDVADLAATLGRHRRAA